MSDALPEYKIRRSSRARMIRLSITAENGLVVTIPMGFNPDALPKILSQKLDWINSAFDKIKTKSMVRDKLPEKIELKSLDQTWTILYKKSNTRKNVIHENNSRVLLLEGPLTSKIIIRRLLKSWIRSRAELILPPWLDRLSSMAGLPYNGLTIRDQKTRWGSCSASGKINLNMKLILLPPPIVDYILLHELVHTVQLSHSGKFWNELGKYIPDYIERRRGLRQQEKLIERDYPGL